jgi:hypothetical protein
MKKYSLARAMIEAKGDADPIAYPGDLGIGTGTGDEIEDLVGEDSSGEVADLDAEIQSAQADAESYTGGSSDSSKASSAAAAKRVVNQKTLSMLMQKRAKAAGMFAEGQDSYSHSRKEIKMKMSRNKLQEIINEEIVSALNEAKSKKDDKEDGALEDAWAGGDNLDDPKVWQDVLDMIKEELALCSGNGVEEDIYGEVPAGMQMIYSKPEALDAVSGIADQTDCPVTKDALMQVIQSLKGSSGGCGA